MSGGLRGFVAQGMDGRKKVTGSVDLLAFYDITTAGSGTIPIAQPCRAIIYAWGAGGSGAVSITSSSASGGGGGAALYKVARVGRGPGIAYTVGAGGAVVSGVNDGNPGSDTTVTLPTGVIRAGAGRGGLRGTGALGGAGGVASGGDINRNGGAGGNQGLAGASPTYGGVGGAGSGAGGGGGAAGFDDIGWMLDGGNGSAGNDGGATNPVGNGGGSGGGNAGGVAAGAPGRLVVMLVKLT